MIIKKYSETRKESEVLHQYNVLHVDNSEFSRYAAGSLLVRYDFIVKNFYSIGSVDEIDEALKSCDVDLLLINYATGDFDLCKDLKRIKKGAPEMIVVIYNFDHSRFEKIQLLKAGTNAFFGPDTPFEDMLFALQEIRPGIVYAAGNSDNELQKAVKAASAESSKDFSKEEIAVIKDLCRGADADQVATKHKLTKAKATQLLHHLQKLTGCETQADFVRFSVLYKVFKPDEKLLAEVGIY